MMRKHGERVMLFCFRRVAAIAAVSRLFTFFYGLYQPVCFLKGKSCYPGVVKLWDFFYAEVV